MIPICLIQLCQFTVVTGDDAQKCDSEVKHHKWNMDWLRECNKVLGYVQHCTPPFPCGGLAFFSPFVDSVTYTQIQAHIPLPHSPDCSCVATVQHHTHEGTYTGCLLTWLGVRKDDTRVRVISDGRTCLGFVRGFLQCNNEYKYDVIISRFVCSISLVKKPT